MPTAHRIIRIFLLATVVGALLVPLAAFALFAWGPRWETDFERRYQRINTGMTVEEVRGVLGPESAEGNESDCQVNRGGRVVNAVHGERVLVWEGKVNGQLVRVGFDRDRVVSKHYFEYDL
jgi:hypothetical protein